MLSRLSNDIALDMEVIARSAGATSAFRAAAAREPALDGLGLDELPKLAHRRDVTFKQQDWILAATIRAYRAGPASFWGPVLLEMLAPALVKAASGALPVPPAIDAEDIQQQVVFEALRAAATMPLPPECRFVQARLVSLANKRLKRWHAREQRRQAFHLESLDKEG